MEIRVTRVFKVLMALTREGVFKVFKVLPLSMKRCSLSRESGMLILIHLRYRTRQELRVILT